MFRTGERLLDTSRRLESNLTLDLTSTSDYGKKVTLNKRPPEFSCSFFVCDSVWVGLLKRASSCGDQTDDRVM